MASIAYERYEAEIEAADVDINSDSESQDSRDALETSPLTPQQSDVEREPVFTIEQRQYQDVFHGTGMWCISFMLALLGFILAILGTIETVVFPLIFDTTGQTKVFWLQKNNCFGVILWAGIWLTLTSSFGLRAAHRKSILSANIFFSIVLLNLILYSMALVMVLVGYTSGWTTKAAYPSNEAFFYLHIGCTVMLCFSFAILILAFTRFYEDVFCDRLHLFKHWVHCCCPCWCPRPVNREELLDDAVVPPDQRPPSIPI